MKVCREHRRILAPLLILCLIMAAHLPMWTDVPVSQAEQEQSFGIRNPIIGSDGITIWDCIQFGSYWQNDTNGDGKADRNDEKEPIRWRVLSIKGNDVFLLADKNLEMKQYNDTYKAVTWKTCSLRTWLNKDFLADAFTAAERPAIQQAVVVNEKNANYGTDGGNDTKDSIYLLSLSEVQNAEYGFSSSLNSTDARKALNTAYATSQGAYESSSGNGHWRLRSPGDNSSRAAYVSYDGSVSENGNNVNDNVRAIRPALHLDLSVVAEWSYVGTVNSKNLYQENPSNTVPGVSSAPGSTGQPGGNTPSGQPGGNTSSGQPGGSASSDQSNGNVSPDGVAPIANNRLDVPDKSNADLPKAGSVVTVSGFQYKILKSTSKEKTAVLIKATNKKIKKANIPNTVRIQSASYKVVEISKNAFKGCGQLQTATIGKEIQIIGKGAFSGCKKIKKIIIRSKILKKIGKGAFSGVSRIAKIQVPKSKVVLYRKLMKKG